MFIAAENTGLIVRKHSLLEINQNAVMLTAFGSPIHLCLFFSPDKGIYFTKKTFLPHRIPPLSR